MAILSSCASADQARLERVAARKAAADAPPARAFVPDDCRFTEPHAPLVRGAEVLGVLKRERVALDRQNARTRRCAEDAQRKFDQLAAD